LQHLSISAETLFKIWKDFQRFFLYTKNRTILGAASPEREPPEGAFGIAPGRRERIVIYTLTMNPAVDMNINSQGIHPKVVNRTWGSFYSHNGKGINLTRVLRHFGQQSAAIGFFGGFSGKFIVESLEKEGVPVYSIPVEETTRINIFLNDGSQEYKFVSAGAQVSPEAQQQLLKLLEELPEFDYFTINGSLPPGIEESFYDDILEVCRRRGAKVVLDISSKRMPELLRFRPLLIKPNDEEVREIWGRTLGSLDDVADTMKFIHGQGAENILLTLGDKGMLFSDGKEIWFCDAPKVKLVSSACAGDSCLAAFLSEWLGGGSLETAMKKGSATGADVAGSNGIGDLLRVETYMQTLSARKVR